MRFLDDDVKIWEFDVDNTLVMWNRSEFPPEADRIFLDTDKGIAELVINQFNINLLVKLAKIGYYIRVHSGSGGRWAKRIVEALALTDYVDEIEPKPRGKTDDKPPGEGITYLAYRDALTGKEIA